MKRSSLILLLMGFLFTVLLSCGNKKEVKVETKKHASQVLREFGPQALAFGGYRHTTRDSVPSVAELKEDMLILNRLGCHLIRTYHTQQFGQVKNLLKAISELKESQPDFEMYVMLGAWIQCMDAWTSSPIRENEDLTNNKSEIAAAVNFAKQYPDIIKIIAVGNEAMVHWAYGYYVKPRIILKYVDRLQSLKRQGELNSSIWITSSDNFASWGGGDEVYRNSELNQLIKAVDYVSLHTYPFHDTHYNPSFWKLDSGSTDPIKNADQLMEKAVQYAQGQYQSTVSYIHKIDSTKAVHIGETGWASHDVKLYGAEGSGAADEFKQRLYYQKVRQWCQDSSIACFYFEAFDEPWKDAQTLGGSENHFGLITVDGVVKSALWQSFDKNKLENLTRGRSLEKSFQGNTKSLHKTILSLPKDSMLGSIN